MTVTEPGEPTPTDTIIRVDGICMANARFIRPFDLGEHTFMEKPLVVNLRSSRTGAPHKTLPPCSDEARRAQSRQRHGQAFMIVIHQATRMNPR